MAQQTQIKTMLPYFERWMKRFPDFETLADALEEDVLKHWEGLGYYSRARNLHKLAKAYVESDPKPKTREDWKTLPGIGPYTSAAIASISFGEPVAVVDGNVVRTLARLTGDERSFTGNGDAVKAFTPLAEELINLENPGDHNQAMMELGATVCLKRKPLCTLCHVQQFCQSYGRIQVESIPRIERKATEHIEIPRAWIIQNAQILLYRIPKESGQLAGQYELPNATGLSSTLEKMKPILSKTRSITHRRIKEPIYHMEAPESLPQDHHWISLKDLESITLSGPHRRWLKELADRADTKPG